MKFRFFVFSLFLVLSTLSIAQSVRVLRFSAIPSNAGDKVQILWTMNAGSTCPDLVVERSSNGINYFEVYQYPSVCGSSDSAVSYSWIDGRPLQFAKSFYRLKLDGNEFSLPVEIDLQSNLNQKDIIAYPSPSNGTFTIELKNENNLNFKLEIYNPLGQMIYSEENCTGTIRTVKLSDQPRGTYTIKAFFTDRSSIVSKLIIRQ